MIDLNYARGVLHIRQGGTGLSDVGPAGSVLTSDGIRATWSDQTSNIFTGAANLYVDPTLGNDNNNGLQLAPTALASGVGPAAQVPGPLKTWAELRRRIGSNKLSNAAGCVITINGDLPASDPFIVDFGATVPVNITGVPTQTSVNTSRNTTASVNRVTATSTPYSMTDAGVTWANFLSGYIIAFTAGAAANAFTVPVKDNGAGSVRLGVNTATANLAGVQMYDIRRLSVINSAIGASLIAPTSGPSWAITYLNFINAPTIGTSLPISFGKCQISMDAWSSSFAQLAFFSSLLLFTTGAQASFSQCAVTLSNGGVVGVAGSSLRLSGGSFIHQWSTFQTVAVFEDSNNFCNFFDAGFFDTSNPSLACIDIGTGASATVQTLYGATAVPNMVPMILEPNVANVQLVLTPTFLASAPAAAVKVGTVATAAAWPAVTGKSVDANSAAVLTHV